MPTTIPTTTSSTRPGSPSAGDAYFETDTKNYIIYDGANWRGYVSDGLSGWSGSNTYSMNFDGTDDYLTGSAVTPTAQQGTISAWIKTTNTGNSVVLSQSDNTVADQCLFLRLQGANAAFGFVTGSTISIKRGSTTINDGNWHHIVWWSDGTNWKIYVDGGDEGTLTSVTGSAQGLWLGDLTSSNNLAIGMRVRNTTDLVYNGNIDEVAIWDSTLSASQITNIYKGESNGGSGGTNGTPGNLLSFSPKAWWRMGDGAEANSGTTIYDMSSFSNNMTIVNATSGTNTAGAVYQADTP